MRLRWTGVVGILLYLMVLGFGACADNLSITASPERYHNRDVGVVYINGAVVMRFYANGVYPSAYLRAKDVADMLTDIGAKGADLSAIQVMNGTTEIVGIVGNRNVFRVLEDDVIYNNTTAESLAADWANNIKSAVNLAKVDVPVAAETQSQTVAPPRSKDTPALAAPPRAEPQASSVIPASPKHKPSWMAKNIWVYLSAIFLLGAIGGIIYIVAGALIKRRKLHHEEKIISKKASTDELENTVSHLIAELEEKSARITAEFQEKIDYLESLMMTVDRKIEQLETVQSMPMSQPPLPTRPEPPDEDFPVMPEFDEPDREPVSPPVKIARKPAAAKEVGLKKDKPASAPPEKQHRTKQELIYEMSDQGKGVTEIAKKLGIGVGEVKLILDLKQ